MTVQSRDSAKSWGGGDLLERAWHGQPMLATLGLVMVVLAIPTLVALGLDERTLNGVSVWAKPLKFQLSLAVHALTVAWLMLFLPEPQRSGVFSKGLAAVIVATAVFEIVYITWQGAIGEASHYNMSTPFTRTMYSLMGFAAISLLVATAGIGLMILRHGNMRDPVAFAAGLGLVLGSLLGGATGIYMGGQAGHWVGGAESDVGGLPLVGWVRDGGDLRVAHFFGLHTIQALPLAAWCCANRLALPFRKPVILVAAFCAFALTAAVFVQALNGRSLLPA